MEMIKYNTAILTNANELFNTSTFVDRVYCFLVELGMELNYGDYISKYYKNGMIKLLKSLDLYKTTGRGDNKITLIDPRIAFVVDTTIADSTTQAKSIIKLVNQEYNFDNFIEYSLEKYNQLECGQAKKTVGSFSTYIIYNPNNELYKIGMSKNVYNRFSQLKNEVAPNIELIAYCENDYESEIHFKYKEKRRFGEWFSLTMDDVLDIYSAYNFEEFVKQSTKECSVSI
jgi:hypothetical protein